MLLPFLFPYLMLNMFRMLIHPSSGACDLFVELFHGLYCSVRIEVFVLACLFIDECFVVTCVIVFRKRVSVNIGCYDFCCTNPHVELNLTFDILCTIICDIFA